MMASCAPAGRRCRARGVPCVVPLRRAHCSAMAMNIMGIHHNIIMNIVRVHHNIMMNIVRVRHNFMMNNVPR